MTVKFVCPNCGKRFSAPASLAGERRTCPRCQKSMTVPRPEEADAVAEDKRPASDHPMLLVKQSSAHPEDLIDMTAMVDIVFFLLIFFLVTSMQSLESVIGLPTPQASSATAPAGAVNYASDPSYVTVTIEGDDTVWVDDQQVFGEQDLRVKLRAIRKEDPGLIGMLVSGDPEASHGTLVMVLDAGADVGMEELRFSVAEQGEGG